MANPQPKFKDGDKVYNSVLGKDLIVSGEPLWNGFTYMYSFKMIQQDRIEMRCGESYLMDYSEVGK